MERFLDDSRECPVFRLDVTNNGARYVVMDSRCNVIAEVQRLEFGNPLDNESRAAADLLWRAVAEKLARP